MKLFLMLVVVFVVSANAYVALNEDDYQLSETITDCDEDDPKLNDCVRDALQKFLPSLKNGNKKLFIPPLDPYKLANLKRNFNVLGIVDGTLGLKGVKVYGMSDATIHSTNLAITDKRSSLDVVMSIPRLHFEGKYKSEIKINDLTLTPKGYFNITMTNVKLIALMSGKFTTIAGSTHLVLDKFDAEQDTDDVKVYASGLLPDPQLNNAVLTLANQYWSEIMRIGLPETKDQWAPVIIDILNEFLQRVPFNKLLNRKI